jgi:hypothetical protein
MSAQSEHEEFRAGALTMAFDRSGGQLRWFKYGTSEVLRGIYGAVRDENWDTISPRIEQLSINRDDDNFRIEFTALCKRETIDYRWRGEIVGTADSVVRYRFAGVSHSTFLRNRIGLCVLHPIRDCAGRPCQLVHTDGTTEDTEFPLAIAPDQPFVRVAALRHCVVDGVDAEVRFHGDVFETEDQRNWTDASFKTYSTPLELPFPVEVRPGDTVEQEVVVRLLGNTRRLSSRQPEAAVTLVVGQALNLPRIGFTHPGRAADLNESEVARLTLLRPQHLRAVLRLEEPAFMLDLQVAAADARRLGTQLQVVLNLSDGGEHDLVRSLDDLLAYSTTVAEWTVLDRGNVASANQLQQIRAALGASIAEPCIGLGTSNNFAELNRSRPASGIADFLTYDVNPQTHAFDNATIVENLAGQSETARTARSFSGGAAVQVGPITLRWQSPVDINATVDRPRATIPRDADPRQTSTFLAGWALGSIAALSQERVAAATYFELAGCRGIVGSHRQAQLPAPFGPLAAAVYPVYHVFADIAELRDGKWYALKVDMPDAVFGLLCRHAQSVTALVSNITERPWACRLPFTPSRLRVLDHTSESSATHAPGEFRNRWYDGSTAEIVLAPRSYVRVEGAAP